MTYCVAMNVEDGIVGLSDTLITIAWPSAQAATSRSSACTRPSTCSPSRCAR